MLIRDIENFVLVVEHIESAWVEQHGGPACRVRMVSGKPHTLTESTYVKLLAWWESNANFL